jgi:ribose transport system substrate-binding protein
MAVAAAALVPAGGCKKDPGAAAEQRARKAYKAPDGATPKYAFVTNNSSEFWKIAYSGVRKFEKEAGVKVLIKEPATGMVAEQNQIIDDLLAQGYNGIAVSPIAPDDQKGVLNKAAAQTNLVTHDSDAAKSNRLIYVGTDNFEAGKALGAKVVELMPQGGKVAVFVGTFSADNARERLRGLEEGVKGKNITVVAKKEDNKDQGRARSNVDDVLVSTPDVKLLVGLWSYNGPQIAAGIDGAGKKGQVLAAVFDDEADTLSAIDRGTIQATVVQRQYEFAYEAMKQLQQAAKTGQVPEKEMMPTGVEIVTKDTLSEFKERTQKMLSGQ